MQAPVSLVHTTRERAMMYQTWEQETDNQVDFCKLEVLKINISLKNKDQGNKIIKEHSCTGLKDKSSPLKTSK